MDDKKQKLSIIRPTRMHKNPPGILTGNLGFIICLKIQSKSVTMSSTGYI